MLSDNSFQGSSGRPSQSLNSKIALSVFIEIEEMTGKMVSEEMIGRLC